MTKLDPKDRSFEDIGARLKAIRKITGLSQKEFAAKAGIKDTTYNQYENGASQPKIEYARALCDTYGLSLDWLYNGDTSNLPFRIATELLKQAKDTKEPV